MRLYHKLHRNPCKTDRAMKIRNIGKRVDKMLRKNPTTHREVFEEIFGYRRRAEDFHGLEVRVIGKSTMPDGGVGYIIEHPWIPVQARTRKKQITVRVCTPRRAKQIGAVSVMPLRGIGRKEKPKAVISEEIEDFCCLDKEPETPKPGKKYANRILLCMGERRTAPTAIARGRRPEVGESIAELYRELSTLSDRELDAIDKMTKAKEAYMRASPTSPQQGRLKREYDTARSELFAIQGRKEETKKKISRQVVTRPEPVRVGGLLGGRAVGMRGRTLSEAAELAGGGPKTRRGLAFRYGEEEAARLAAEERAMREAITMRTAGKAGRLVVNLNERFSVPGTPFIGVVWDKKAFDKFRGVQVGHPTKYRWELFDGAGRLIKRDVASSKSAAVRRIKEEAAEAIAPIEVKGLETRTLPFPGRKDKFRWEVIDRTGKTLDIGITEGPGAKKRAQERAAQRKKELAEAGQLPRGGYEAATIREAVMTGRAAPSLALGEKKIVQLIPETGPRIPESELRKRARADLQDILRWGLPSAQGLIEFRRDRKGYWATIKTPAGVKYEDAGPFGNMDQAVKQAISTMERLTKRRDWSVLENPKREKNPPKKRRRKKRNLKKNPLLEDVQNILAIPFVGRPKRKRVPITAEQVPGVQARIEELAWQLDGKTAYDFGFTAGVLRGIDTCGITKVVERRRIRREVEQQMLDALYGLTVTAPGSENPRKRKRRKTKPKKNPLLEDVQDILAVPFVGRAKRKRVPITASQVPEMKTHIENLAWQLDGKTAYDFGFTAGVLRGIDTCGITKVAQRRKIRREVEQQMIDALTGLSVRAPGGE